MALSPLPDQTPTFSEDFERYRGEADLQKSFQVWQDGAHLNVALQKRVAGAGNQAMRVEALTPHPQTGSGSGSIYHVLSSGDRNWGGATGMRFWVKNVSEEPLLLSLNFKERFNEYWAVAENGSFLLEGPDGYFQRKDIEYSNLPIPPNYSGYVVIPLMYFSVPDWNTARGNERMDLKAIESFAFGVTVPSFPHVFILDEISVIGDAEYPYLEIKGSQSVMTPASGEYREPYIAYLSEPISGSSRMVAAKWLLPVTPDETISIDADGWLSVPVGSTGGALTVSAVYSGEGGELIDNLTVLIQPEPSNPSAQPEEDQRNPPDASTASDYERFSRDFEAWAVSNRPHFVLLSIAAVLVVLAALSFFQKKIK